MFCKERLFLLDLKQLDVEDKCRVGLDGTCAVGAVGKIGRDEQPVGCTLTHELQTLDPTGDYLTYSEGGGLAALHAAVKYGAVDQFAGVMNGDHVVGTGLQAFAFFYDLILQAAGGYLDALNILASLLISMFIY